MDDYASLSERLAEVRSAIVAATGSEREIRIVAVTKTHPVSAVVAALEVGLSEVGENYADELATKARQAAELGLHPRWHYIGAIQRRRLRLICEHASVIETVTRDAELTALADLGFAGELLIQVKPPGVHEGRNGADPDDVILLVEHARLLGLDVVGLMGMALPGSEESVRAYFRSVHTLGESLGLREYSMGMSSDYRVAVAQGATMVRLGSVLFGSRM